MPSRCWDPDKVNLSNQCVDDDLLKHPLDDDTLEYAQVIDLSYNLISAEGIAALRAKWQPQLIQRVLKLHHNIVGELFGTGALRSLDELHLSDNLLTETGITDQVEAAVRASEWRPRQSRPLWLWLDSNNTTTSYSN